MSLWSEFLTNRVRVIHKWTHYFPIYENHFKRYVNRPMLFVEIGCSQGGSLQLWKRYLGPLAQIVGIDILDQCKALEENQIAVRIGDQSDTVFLGNVLTEFGPPDVILDDGSHAMQHVRASLPTFIHACLPLAFTWSRIYIPPIGLNWRGLAPRKFIY
jgi:hypothetical protein